MATGTIFTTNRTQAVRLPAETRFPETVKAVTVRVVGQERIIAPKGTSWDSFFLEGDGVTEDFLAERASQVQHPREDF